MVLRRLIILEAEIMFGVSLFSPSGSFTFASHFTTATVYLQNDLSALAEVPTVLKHKQ